MDPIPYTNFWVEEPEIQKKAWRPSDDSRRKLNRLWVVQGLLLIGIIVLATMITVESKKVPPIYAKLPNGIVYETTAGPLKMDRLARMELVNNTLQILYYQEGSYNYLDTIRQNVKPAIIAQLQVEMQSAVKQTNTTVYLSITETFEILNIPAKGFEAMTKGELIKRSSKESTTAPIYVRTRWLKHDDRYLLSRIEEVKPGDYYDLFLAEKERLRRLPKEELQRELDVKKNQDIPLPKRHALF